MKLTTLNFKVENTTKQSFELFCQRYGLTMSGMFNLFLHKCLRTNEVPFEINDAFDPVEIAKKVESINDFFDNIKDLPKYNDAELKKIWDDAVKKMPRSNPWKY